MPEFLRTHLNITVSLPKDIPGPVSQHAFPTDLHSVMRFGLERPAGKGQITIASATTTDSQLPSEQQKLIIWELEAASIEDVVPDYRDQAIFVQWLDEAHSVLHEWFFRLIEGELFKEFSK